MKLILHIRNLEKKLIFLGLVLRSVIDGIIFLLPMIAAIACITLYQVIYEDLTLGEIFLIINLFNLFTTPLRVFFFGLIGFLDAKVSIRRIESILKFPDEENTNDFYKDNTSFKVG